MTADVTETAAPSLEGRIRKGALWGVLNNLGLRFANIAVMAVVVRLVTHHEFGVFAVALTVAVVVGGFADWGVSAFLMRGDHDPDEVAPTVTFISVLSGAVLAGLVALAAPWLASALGAPDATGPIRVMSLCLLFGGMAAVPTALLAREFRQDRIMLSNVVGFVPANILLVVLAFHGSGAMAFAWSRVATVVFQCLAAAFLVGRVYLPRLETRHLRVVLVFGLPLAGANLVNYALVNADYALIGHQLGPALLGVYLLAFNVCSWSMAVLSAAINGVAMPAFSRVGDDGDLLHAALRRSARAVSLVALPISVLTFALARPLVTTLYGGTWAASIPVLEVLSVYGGLFVVISLLSNLLVGRGRTARALVIQVAWILTLVPAMLVGSHLTGLRGVAWAHVAVLVAIVLPLYLWSVGQLVPRAVRAVAVATLPPLFTATVAGAAAAAAAALPGPPATRLLLGGLAGGATYVLLSAPMLADFVSPHRLGPLARLIDPLRDLGRRVMPDGSRAAQEQ
ncbi:oligosaccharide flippase family protein [Nocardioides sp. CER19]|uniref:oligosaccharide flippase family protein n=1 Tax=Nocardioides sp. CER19 TaxID=3038538 RepID=UPI00244B0E61|nr:oligosaccharide flippase family protein [Nocardioides sp. CER19]MDH2414819.1 oligosaccharide flippase family protein [Nocardioides sp. CER19]